MHIGIPFSGVQTPAERKFIERSSIKSGRKYAKANLIIREYELHILVIIFPLIEELAFLFLHCCFSILFTNLGVGCFLFQIRILQDFLFNFLEK